MSTVYFVFQLGVVVVVVVVSVKVVKVLAEVVV